MASTTPSLAHFRGSDVLDPVFQQMTAGDVARQRPALSHITQALQNEGLRLSMHVAARTWAQMARDDLSEEETDEVRDR
jgi:hypothetical protein